MTFLDTLATTLSETDLHTIGDTLENVKSAELKHMLRNAPEKAKAGRLSTRLIRRLRHFMQSRVEASILIGALA